MKPTGHHHWNMNIQSSRQGQLEDIKRNHEDWTMEGRVRAPGFKCIKSKREITISCKEEEDRARIQR